MRSTSWSSLAACVAGGLCGSTISALVGTVGWHAPIAFLVVFLFCVICSAVVRRREIALANFQQQAAPPAHPSCRCAIPPTSFVLEAHEEQNVRAPRGPQ